MQQIGLNLQFSNTILIYKSHNNSRWRSWNREEKSKKPMIVDRWQLCKVVSWIRLYRLKINEPIKLTTVLLVFATIIIIIELPCNVFCVETVTNCDKLCHSMCHRHINQYFSCKKRENFPAKSGPGQFAKHLVKKFSWSTMVSYKNSNVLIAPCSTSV